MSRGRDQRTAIRSAVRQSRLAAAPKRRTARCWPHADWCRPRRETGCGRSPPPACPGSSARRHCTRASGRRRQPYARQAQRQMRVAGEPGQAGGAAPAGDGQRVAAAAAAVRAPAGQLRRRSPRPAPRLGIGAVPSAISRAQVSGQSSPRGRRSRRSQISQLTSADASRPIASTSSTVQGAAAMPSTRNSRRRIKPGREMVVYPG